MWPFPATESYIKEKNNNKNVNILPLLYLTGHLEIDYVRA